MYNVVLSTGRVINLKQIIKLFSVKESELKCKYYVVLSKWIGLWKQKIEIDRCDYAYLHDRLDSIKSNIKRF